MENVELHLGDCYDILAEYPDREFALMLTDPPTGQKQDAMRKPAKSHRTAKTNYGAWDWDELLEDVLIFEMMRVAKNSIIWQANFYTNCLPPSSCWLVWDKHQTWFSECELAWTTFEGGIRKFDFTWNGMMQGDMKNKEPHLYPTQKPVPLMRWCIEMFTKPGDVVIDPCMGSGTTGVAAVQLGRSFVGIDARLEAFSLAEQRIAEAKKQMVMF